MTAFLAWSNSPRRECCDDMGSAKSHWGRKVIKYERKRADGKILSLERNDDFSLADAYVCARERAWREYISVRDGINYHIEPLFNE